ncbi:hypothetical protein Tco_0099700 [Tanacetum coccineum]
MHTMTSHQLIPEDPQPDVPRVAIPRAQRTSLPDLYEMMGSMEIRQGAIERMASYNPPGYAQPLYDQYYQQYPSQQQSQPDDE